MTRTSTSRETSRLLGVIVAVVVVAALYFARIVFIPVALALLFSLLLAPVIAFLQRIRLPRLLAIFLVVVSLVGLAGLIGWKTSQQLADLTNQLPTYTKNLGDKIHALKNSKSQSLNKVSAALTELEQDIARPASGAHPANEARKKAVTPGSSEEQPLAVRVVPPANSLGFVEQVLGPLGTVAIVIVFTIFMLMGREDLRNRFIRLIGGGHLTVMTQVLDETTHRIHRYLLLQTMVNASYGVVIGIGLHFIGIPNAWLWGVTTAILRFLPYIGPPMAALMPIVLSLAVFPGWYHALATMGLYIVLELAVANFVEPRLYGAHVGLSPLAILVAAVFWTLIWGFPGLLLSTPLTVSLVVMGRHVPSLSFLSVLLGDQPVLSPAAQYYQRLLATDQNEARQILELYSKEKSLEELYSSVVIPALSLAEQDRHRNKLDEETQDFIYQSSRELIEEFGDIPAEPAPNAVGNPDLPIGSQIRNEGTRRLDVLCIPARDTADDVVALILCQLLERQGHNARSISIGATSEMLSQVTESKPGLVCISALPPFALEYARALYGKLRLQSPELPIVICLWHFEGDAQKMAARFKLAPGDGFFTTLHQVLKDVAFRSQTRNA
ncbi:MAG: AI-2E family transporter [Candidatus Acidiferrales bacterium]